MKRSVKIVRALQVESSIVSWMFMGYFALLVAGGIMIAQQRDDSAEQTTAETAGGSGATPMKMAE
jgi:hypothetical protein